MPDLISCIEFTREQGIEVVIESGVTGFCRGIEIRAGAIYVDASVATVASFLHEVGHIACVPKRFRYLFTGDVQAGQCAMLDEIALMALPPDDPLEIAAMQCGDVEATAWAWAAGVHLGLKESLIIEDADYSNGGEDVRFMLKNNAYFGINGMARAGFCAVRPRVAAYSGLPVYPKLARWTQV